MRPPASARAPRCPVLTRRLCNQILHAARITFAQFSVLRHARPSTFARDRWCFEPDTASGAPSDRELVAQLDDFALSTRVAQHVTEHVCSDSEAPAPYSEFLQMLLFVATGGFFKEGGYRAFARLPYPDQVRCLSTLTGTAQQDLGVDSEVCWLSGTAMYLLLRLIPTRAEPGMQADPRVDSGDDR